MQRERSNGARDEEEEGKLCVRGACGRLLGPVLCQLLDCCVLLGEVALLLLAAERTNDRSGDRQRLDRLS
eukprot:706716-Hanusia_phi.AAC.1